MPTGHDPTRIYKNHISPKHAHKLGASAAWSKVKYQSHKIIKPNTATNGNTITNSNNGVINGSNKKSNDNTKIIEFGDNGEVFIAYTNSNTIEVWDWIPSVLEINQLESQPTSNLMKLNQLSDSNNTLYLVASIQDIKGTITNITPLKCDQYSNTYTVLITTLLNNSKSDVQFIIKSFGQLFPEEQTNYQLILPPFVYGTMPYHMDNSNRFIGVATNEGSLTIFNQEKDYCPLSMALDCAIINDKPLFSIEGRYLAYVPKTTPVDIPKTPVRLVPSSSFQFDDHADGNDSKVNFYSILTNLSNTAIDGIYKLGDLNYIKQNLQHYNLKENIKGFLSNILHNGGSFKQQQYIIIIDLVKESTLGCFQPPNGVSNLSLSPFNSQLVSVSIRGDEFYEWDLAKLPNCIALQDIQIRGKTSSIVDEIYWSMHDCIQIITRSSGSLHSFKFDTENSNGSTNGGGGTETNTDNWILSNMQFNKLSQTSSSLLAHCSSRDLIYLIDPITGTTSITFTMPTSLIAKSLLPTYIKPQDMELEEKVLRNIIDKRSSDMTPLAQIEIESCDTTTPISHKLEMGQYAFHSTSTIDIKGEIFCLEKMSPGDGSFTNFRKLYGLFGNPIGWKKFEVEESCEVDGVTVEGGLKEALEDVLVLDPDT